MTHAPATAGADLAIQAIHARYHDQLRSLPAHVAVVDAAGAIKLVNPTWRSFARQNGGDDEAYLGRNYLDVCGRSAEDDADAGAALEGVSAVLCGDLPEFFMEYPCHSPSERRWFRMDVTPLGARRRSGLIVAHADITKVKLQRLALEEMAASVGATLAEADPPLEDLPILLRANTDGDATLLGETVVEAHYLAARLLAFVKCDDFSAKEQTHFAAMMMNQWATAIGTDMFEGKKFFGGGGS